MGEIERESDVEVDAEVTEAQAEITDAEVEVTDAEAEITDAEAEVAEVEIADAEVDAEVTEALAHVSSISDINVELSSHDIQEKDSVVTFMEAGCHCKLWNGKDCSLQFSPSEVEEVRLSCLALSKSELDMVVMGQIMANSNSSAITEASKHLPLARKKKYTKYFHQGKAVCPAMFRFLHSIGETRLKNLVRNFKDDGLSPRTHGNTNKLPHNTLSISSVEFVVRFLLNYADQNCILLPGRIPGYSRSDIKLLPSSISKRTTWRVYQESANSAGNVHPVAYTTFCKLWRSLLPSIVIMKPMTDLCWECQRNSAAILRAVNCPTAEKSATLKKAEEHLLLVQKEQSFYKSILNECRHVVHDYFSSTGSFTPPPLSSQLSANSNPIKVHYSFDYAQTIHYPSDPLQPGPIYFLTPRKCSVFGVQCEALPRQVNFLTDEASDCGKGANSVISMLHFFFDHHGLGE